MLSAARRTGFALTMFACLGALVRISGQVNPLPSTVSVTLHVTNPLPGGGPVPGVSVTMSAGSTTKLGTTGLTGTYTGAGFSVDDNVKIVYKLGGYVSNPTTTSVIAHSSSTYVEGTLVPSTVTLDEAPLLIAWINGVAAQQASSDQKRLVYQREWLRVQQLSPDVQRVVGLELKKGPGFGYLQTIPSYERIVSAP